MRARDYPPAYQHLVGLGERRLRSVEAMTWEYLQDRLAENDDHEAAATVNLRHWVLKALEDAMGTERFLPWAQEMAGIRFTYGA